MLLRKALLSWAVFGILGVEAGLCKPTRTTSSSLSTSTTQSQTSTTTKSTSTTFTSTTLTSSTPTACVTVANPGFDVNGGEGWTGSAGQASFVNLGPDAHSPPGSAELVVTQLGTSAASGISQKLISRCLTSGDSYFLSFYFKPTQQAPLDNCRVGTFIDGVAQQWGFTQQPPQNVDPNGWTQFEGLFFAPSNEPTIEIRTWCTDFDSGGPSRLVLNIDDVSIRFADLSY